MTEYSNSGVNREVTAKPGKYLAFQLAGEVYGLEILRIQEIIGMMNVTRVPRLPEFVRGVINLRGRVIPVVDLRLKFGLPAQGDTPRTCIIVVQVPQGQGWATLGVIVDEVAEVLSIKTDQFDASPVFGQQVDTAFILGMAKVGQRVIILLDIQKVLSGDEDIARQAA